MTVVHRLACVVLLLIPACGPSESPVGREVVDDLGRRLTVTNKVRRVVSLAPSVTELAVAAGASGIIVGVTEADSWPPALVDGLPHIQALPVDHEAVVALQPDLVLASDQINDPRDAERLMGLGIPTWFAAVHSIDDVFRSIEALGRVLGTEAAASRTVDSLRSGLLSLREHTSVNGPRVLVLIGDETLFAFGRGSYVHDIVALAGGRSVTADFDSRAPILSEEYVIDTAPDIIIGAFGDGYDGRRLLELHPSWSDVPAVRTGRIRSMDPDLLLRPGPRLVQGALTMADLIATVQRESSGG